VGKFDTETANQASHYVTRLQRRIWRCQLCMVGLPFIATPIFAFWHELNSLVLGIFLSVFLVIAAACLLVGNAAWLQLVRFRCPRCGDHFISPFGFGYRNKVCRHCGLGEAAEEGAGLMYE
jgi:ribosomal protein L37AE/L43A